MDAQKKRHCMTCVRARDGKYVRAPRVCRTIPVRAEWIRSQRSNPQQQKPCPEWCGLAKR